MCARACARVHVFVIALWLWITNMPVRVCASLGGAGAVLGSGTRDGTATQYISSEHQQRAIPVPGKGAAMSVGVPSHGFGPQVRNGAAASAPCSCCCSHSRDGACPVSLVTTPKFPASHRNLPGVCRGAVVFVHSIVLYCLCLSVFCFFVILCLFMSRPPPFSFPSCTAFPAPCASCCPRPGQRPSFPWAVDRQRLQ